MSALPWIVGGGALATGAYFLLRRDHVANPDPTATPASDVPLSGRWAWPLGIWNGRHPEISDGFDGKRRTSTGTLIPHGGVDLMYRRQPADTWPVGSPNGSRGYVMPEHRAALAASGGVVEFAAHTPRGWSVVIDHQHAKVATYYTHMSELLVIPHQAVSSGQPIGLVGADPLDAAHLKHLHFELWRAPSRVHFDPQPFMRTWDQLPDPGDMPHTLVASNTRNARKKIEHALVERFAVREHPRGYPRRY
jgi:murein DD-endopeptidase MepM/ murein hydrolase activator NlpD